MFYTAWLTVLKTRKICHIYDFFGLKTLKFDDDSCNIYICHCSMTFWYTCILQYIPNGFYGGRGVNKIIIK